MMAYKNKSTYLTKDYTQMAEYGLCRACVNLGDCFDQLLKAVSEKIIF